MVAVLHIAVFHSIFVKAHKIIFDAAQLPYTHFRCLNYTIQRVTVLMTECCGQQSCKLHAHSIRHFVNKHIHVSDADNAVFI